MTSFADVARAHFPALLSGFIFADNAGGSQCTELVAKRIFDYLINTNTQPVQTTPSLPKVPDAFPRV